MASPEIKCPNCGASIGADAVREGQVECPQCHKKFKLTQQQQKEVAGIPIDLSLHTAVARQAEKKRTKTCPSCNTVLDAEAIICPSCGLNLRTGERLDVKTEVEAEAPKIKILPLIGAIILLLISAYMVKRTFFGGKKEETKPQPVVKKALDKKKLEELKKREAEVAKQEEERRKRAEEAARRIEQRRKEQAQKFFEQAEKSEKKGLWVAAKRCYEESNRLIKNEEAVKRAKAVDKLIEGLKLRDTRNWDGALAKFNEALPLITNKDFVQQNIEYCNKRKEYEQLCAQSEKLQEDAKWDGARKLLIQAEEVAKLISKIRVIDQTKKKEVLTDLEEKKKAFIARKRDFDSRHERMQYAFGLLEKHEDYIALLGAAKYYASKPEYRFFLDEINEKKKLAEEGIKNKQQQPVAMPVEEPVNLIVLKLKDGSEIKGKILRELPVSFKIEVKDGDAVKTRFISKSDVVERRDLTLEPQEANEQTARELLTAAVKAYDGKHYRKALALVEELKLFFPEQKIVKEPKLQEEVIAKASSEVLKLVGKTLDDLEGGCVKSLELACDMCEGACVIPCPVCHGTGKSLQTCRRCGGKGWIYCHACGGTGRRGKYGRLRCPICGGKGKIKCPDCDGKGKVLLPCQRCKPANLKVRCPKCAGVGKIDCDMCGGDGRVGPHNLQICPKCKGSGRIVCPVCKGEGVAEVTEWDYTIKCPKCHGTGKRKLPY